jgi:hypothetical protein
LTLPSLVPTSKLRVRQCINSHVGRFCDLGQFQPGLVELRR